MVMENFKQVYFFFRILIFLKFFLTFNLLTFASFRVGVPSILFMQILKRKLYKYLSKFCHLYQPHPWFKDQFQNTYNLLLLPFVFIKKMTHKQVHLYSRRQKSFKIQLILLFVVFSFTIYSDFYLQEHTLSPISGAGFDSMQVYYSFVLQLLCLQNCSLLTSVQSLEFLQ